LIRKAAISYTLMACTGSGRTRQADVEPRNESEVPLRDVAQSPRLGSGIHERKLRLVVGREGVSSTASRSCARITEDPPSSREDHFRYTLTSIDGPPSPGYPLFWLTVRCLESTSDGTAQVDPEARTHAVSVLQTWADQNHVRIV
jgi:hypothetical protein